MNRLTSSGIVKRKCYGKTDTKTTNKLDQGEVRGMKEKYLTEIDNEDAVSSLSKSLSSPVESGEENLPAKLGFPVLEREHAESESYLFLEIEIRS